MNGVSRMKRIIGKLNTETSDGRMIKALETPEYEHTIPVRVRTDPDGLSHVVGTATWTLEGDDIVAEIRLDNEGTDFETLIPHMEIIAFEHHNEDALYVVDLGGLRSIFFDDQPDAFGDLNA